MTFTATIHRLDDGLRHHYVPIPNDIVDTIKGQGARRVLATINGTEIRRALNSRVGGPTFLILGQPLLKELKLHVGDTVKVSLRIDVDPERVDLAEELQAVLDTDEEAAALFHAMTPGKRRSLELYVSTAKSVDSRIKRALDLAEKLKSRTLYSDRKR
jgi:antitoxin component of MazEF toxin-antitoxin module